MQIKLKIAAIAAGVATAFGAAAVGIPTASADASCSATSTDKVREGDRGAAVEYAQCLLNEKGGYGLEEDGVFGAKTLAATEDFQGANDLAVDGVIGPNTWSALTDGSSEPAPDPGNKGEQIVAFAAAAEGTPYEWGANGPNSYDCSGLTKAAYASVGIDLPRISDDQRSAGTNVSAGDAKPGDLVSWPGHVGIYAGDGMVWHASGSKQEVILSPVWDSPVYTSIV